MAYPGCSPKAEFRLEGSHQRIVQCNSLTLDLQLMWFAEMLDKRCEMNAVYVVWVKCMFFPLTVVT